MWGASGQLRLWVKLFLLRGEVTGRGVAWRGGNLNLWQKLAVRLIIYKWGWAAMAPGTAQGESKWPGAAAQHIGTPRSDTTAGCVAWKVFLTRGIDAVLRYKSFMTAWQTGTTLWAGSTSSPWPERGTSITETTRRRVGENVYKTEHFTYRHD